MMDTASMPRKVDALIVGGGPAGLAAAVKLYEQGIRNIVIIEREKKPGGILRQCIHDGFGVSRFETVLSGPEYAQRFIDEVERHGIPVCTNASVLEITEDHLVTVAAREGLLRWQAKAIILAMGCRERTRGALAIPGERPAGVFTAGVVQSYINLYNRMPVREVGILGSGDIGMMMARRLTMEGAHVQAVFEIQPYPSGLPRNIRQCLDDFNIPLYLSHCVTEIHGSSRLTGVSVAQVDEQLRPIPGTEKEYSCDTLILSVGLIPENELTVGADIVLDGHTGGATVDEFFQTDHAGIFAAGNVLHVHDLVDFVSIESETMACAAARYISGELLPHADIPVHAGADIGHTVPQRVSGQEDFTLSLRVKHPMRDRRIVIRQGGVEIAYKAVKRLVPAEMLQIVVPTERIHGKESLEVSIE